MERSLNATENLLRGTRFVDRGVFKEGFVEGRTVVPEPGPLSYIGPGSGNYLYAAVNQDAENAPFDNTRLYKFQTTFNKVYPICGIDGYFSIQSSTDSKQYLIAVAKDNSVVATLSELTNTVDLNDAACWRELTTAGCPTGQVMLENRKYPGLVMTVGSNQKRITIEGRTSVVANSCWAKSNPNTTLSGLPTFAPKKPGDATIRFGWNLSDDNRSWGPVNSRSYELAPVNKKDWKECELHAASTPNANGFVFLGNTGSFANCRAKVGGYWNENRNLLDERSHARLVSGKF